MGDRYGREDKIKIRQRIAAENIRRVLYTSVICAIVIPVYILINKLSGSEASGIVNGALIGFEFIYLIAAGISFYTIRNHDNRTANIVFRSFWGVFEVTSFILIFSNMHDGQGLTVYSAMLAALMLVPMMTPVEQMYYAIPQLLFVVFLQIRSGGNGSGYFSLVVLNGLMYTLSRIFYRTHCENIINKEKLSEKSENVHNDPLTGLLNHRGLEKRTFELTRECIRERRRLSVLMIDFDDLACYNDTYGSERGDRCISALADVIRQISLRNTDLISRIHGGKFLVVMEGGDDMEPVRLAEKIRTVIEQKRIPHGRRAGNQFVTVSIGAASCIPRSENDYTETYDEAEDSLFTAKEQGKNVTIYEEQMFGAVRTLAQ